MEMLLAASWLLLISAPLPLASEAAAFRFPRIGSYATPARAQQLGKILKKYGPGAVDIATSLFPPPSPPDDGRSSPAPPSGRADSGPAQTNGLYLVALQVGTPPQNVSGILDVSTQFMWMQCAPCTACLTPPSYYFKYRSSSTLQSVPCANDVCQASLAQACDQQSNSCGYVATYGGDTMSTTGSLVNDTFTFGTTPVEGMLFGCSDSTTTGDYSGASGVIGFGRGPLSLVSQLGLSNFSYFLAPDGGDDSQVQLDGVVDVPRTAAARSRSTPLLAGSVYADLYYVGLTGIHVNGRELDGIPPGTFDLQDNGSGGVFLSTTVPVTYLVSEAYTVVRQAFARSISAQPISLDALAPLCYTAQSMVGVNVPSLTLVFKGKDATMELSEANYFFRFSDGERDVECLTVLPSTGASLLGSLLQTGTTMIYDLDNGQLTFEYDTSPSPAPAHQLASESEAPASPSLAMVVALALWMMLV